MARHLCMRHMLPGRAIVSHTHPSVEVHESEYRRPSVRSSAHGPLGVARCGRLAKDPFGHLQSAPVALSAPIRIL